MLQSLKGWVGEKLTTFGMWLRLDETVYRRIDDIILPTRNGTTQIDHVLVSVFGIFVIETKNMQGWDLWQRKRRKLVSERLRP